MELHMKSLSQLMLWVFAMNHTNYARNIPVYLRYLSIMKEQHLAIWRELQDGHFVG